MEAPYKSGFGGSLQVGLPQEMAEAVLGIFRRFNPCEELGSGTLVVDRSAYDDESSVMTYRFATTVFCRAIVAGVLRRSFDDSFLDLPSLGELWCEGRGLA
ncbi:hypothetical protein [Micromonospora sp. WMMD710]|uniref:hypothetical protein n=1 Tax=Micromonospora sp. WMMD710 TaxID=3016085 RepID=UPI002416E23F|nr:hypothetical protein [Micromonospora sp. WMMD710]MDG4756624.1 hypothetical protein [Micromonospora sp. WMMD710]